MQSLLDKILTLIRVTPGAIPRGVGASRDAEAAGVTEYVWHATVHGAPHRGCGHGTEDAGSATTLPSVRLTVYRRRSSHLHTDPRCFLHSG